MNSQKCSLCGNRVRSNQHHRGFWPNRRHNVCPQEKLYWIPSSENFAASIPPLTVLPFTDVLQPPSLVRISASVAQLPVDDAPEHLAVVAVDFSVALRAGFNSSSACAAVPQTDAMFGAEQHLLLLVHVLQSACLLLPFSSPILAVMASLAATAKSVCPPPVSVPARRADRFAITSDSAALDRAQYASLEDVLPQRFMRTCSTVDVLTAANSQPSAIAVNSPPAIGSAAPSNPQHAKRKRERSSTLPALTASPMVRAVPQHAIVPTDAPLPAVVAASASELPVPSAAFSAATADCLQPDQMAIDANAAVRPLPAAQQKQKRKRTQMEVEPSDCPLIHVKHERESWYDPEVDLLLAFDQELHQSRLRADIAMQKEWPLRTRNIPTPNAPDALKPEQYMIDCLKIEKLKNCI
jgi:hypothetical protein